MKKPPQRKRLSPHPLVGKWFHSYTGDEIEWQGRITAMVGPDLFLVALYEWILGANTHERIVPLAAMVAWRFYDTAEEMRNVYTYEYLPRRERLEQGQG